MTTWTAEQIRAEMKHGRKSFVLFGGRFYRDLSGHLAEFLDGDYVIRETEHEVIVHDNYKRRKVE